MGRISSELRGAQPTTLPTATPSATATPAPQPPVTTAAPMEVRFYSAFNSSGANADGSGRHGAAADAHLAGHRHVPVRAVERAGQDAVLAAGHEQQRVLHRHGRQVHRAGQERRERTSSPTRPTARGTSYTPVFRYAYRDAGAARPVDGQRRFQPDLASIVAIRVRLIVDANMARTPKLRRHHDHRALAQREQRLGGRRCTGTRVREEPHSSCSSASPPRWPSSRRPWSS